MVVGESLSMEVQKQRRYAFSGSSEGYTDSYRLQPIAAHMTRPQFHALTHKKVEADDQAGPAVYNFEWQTVDADKALFTNQQESRNEDNLRGQYSVLGADGVLRTVKYTVEGDEGFKAEITNEEGVGPIQKARTHQASTKTVTSHSGIEHKSPFAQVDWSAYTKAETSPAKVDVSTEHKS
ncbi:unnamed protein product [Darwinula stevensoni]|uniref:Uncharacterized protein n=1 Tax=Darwinula stevensoni TaxID=69355 RepID=A0A7R8ZXI0_9CRUS|nr:unnamed protein product [Darwinula stevensoni]CAG0879395.1 unnamed protein product [Darwinula stevensoni]